MKFAIVDTETSGLPIYKDADGVPIPADDPRQPRLASFAMCLVTGDGEVERQVDFYVKPNGWKMTAEATAANGLTDEYLHEHGKDVREALDAYSEAVQAGYAIAAFGAQFDCKIMRGELRRAGMPDLFEETPNVCLMRASMGLGIVKANGKKGWPGLADVCRHFKIELVGQHQAEVDARAAVAIFLKLRELGKLPEPSIHYAKNHPSKETEQ